MRTREERKTIVKVMYVVNESTKDNNINIEGVLAKWIIEQPHLKDSLLEAAKVSNLNMDKIKLYILFS